MAIAKLFRITDTNDQRWHVAARSFSAAVETMRNWECEPHGSDDEVVRSVEAVEDLILSGSREDSLGCYEEIGFAPIPYLATDWTLANNMAFAAEALLNNLPPNEVSANLTEKFWKAIDELRSAVDKYQEVPF